MKTDISGVSQCLNGHENYEYFRTRFGKMIQYDYRTESGKLFSCVAKSLEQARKKRDAWLQSNNR